MTIPNDASPAPLPGRALRTVLIGTSLAEDSDPVVRAGLAVARAAGARVTLIHAAKLEPLVLGLQTAGGLPEVVAESLIEEELAGRSRELARQIERLGMGEAELAGARVLTGAPHRILADTARAIGADLIVVGATGSGPVAAELLGSTADRVLRQAACPVLLVRGELPVPPRRVLAPVDLSPISGHAFARGLELLAPLAGGGRIAVRAVYVLSFLEVVAHRQDGVKPYEEVARLATEQLRGFVQEHRPGPEFEIATAVLPGEARFEILHDLETEPADLVVLGTHGRSGFDRLLLGSVAATVARKAPCSVLLVPPAGLAKGGAEERGEGREG